MAIPKYGGRDCELSTTGVDAAGRSIDSWTVTQEVLAQIEPALERLGCTVWSRPMSSYGNWRTSNSRLYAGAATSSDCLRHWTSAGQCYYSDMGHVEVCTTSCLRPRAFAAQCISTLLAAEAARAEAERASRGDQFRLTTSNADMLDPRVSFGTHLSMQVSEPLWENLMVDPRAPATIGFVTSALAAAVPFFGAGYLLPLKDGTVLYSLSARAHHLKHMKTFSTTQPFGRGLLNSRREAHTSEHERLHLICFDFDILGAALLFSLLQCVLAAAEESYSGLNLVHPLRALKQWSWQMEPANPQLTQTAIMVDGSLVTLPAYLRRLVTQLLKMVRSGLIGEDVAPEAAEMLPRILELTEHAERGDWYACGRHLTWASKLVWLTELARDGQLSFRDPTIRIADHDFSGTDPERGAIWRLWEAGAVDPLCELEQARAFLVDAPSDSRDWARGQIIQQFYPWVESVDWDCVVLRTRDERWSSRLRIELPQLSSLPRHRYQSVLNEATDPVSLHQLLRDCEDAALEEKNGLDDLTNRLATVPPQRDSTRPADSP